MIKKIITKFSYFNLNKVLKYDSNGFAEIYWYKGSKLKFPLLFITTLGIGGINIYFARTLSDHELFGIMNVVGFWFTGLFSIIGATAYLLYFRRFIYSVKINKNWDQILLKFFNYYGGTYEFKTTS